MENAPNHGLDKDDGSNDSAQRVPSSPQGVRPVLATHRHLQLDNTNNNKSSRTNGNFSISSLIKQGSPIKLLSFVTTDQQDDNYMIMWLSHFNLRMWTSLTSNSHYGGKCPSAQRSFRANA
jgi:hypothetical protein